ncbi:AraC family transcriptional regulator [Amycolatopsis rhizosphaerae]|uniref:AraC family transcriptional regulator n=1 Tax=Amycolatopsis rhizosphaerae TaxID=2053003 RepID=A0A558CRZ9_9PSEU|nr:GyrI-like domain-containing protein [Amycolatopsis rhizosphaerae]TVT51536.1 AraC family transcriptional regulator [Amycolatopsis rhizosphaerae]
MRTYEIQAETRQEQPTAIAEDTLPVAEIGPWLGRTYQSVTEAVAAQGAYPAGPPFARFHIRGDDRFTVEAGFPVTAPIEATDRVVPSTLPGGPVVSTLHVGPYDQMEPAYQALTSWVKDHGGEPVGDAWEVYLTNPAEQPDPGAWRTEVVQPYHQV